MSGKTLLLLVLLPLVMSFNESCKENCDENRIQLALEEAVSDNRRSRGGGLLAVSLFDRGRNQTCAASTYVAGRRADMKSSFIESDTPYGIASITKTFVAALTLIYVERNLLDLDSPIIDLI